MPWTFKAKIIAVRMLELPAKLLRPCLSHRQCLLWLWMGPNVGHGVAELADPHLRVSLARI